MHGGVHPREEKVPHLAYEGPGVECANSSCLTMHIIRLAGCMLT